MRKTLKWEKRKMVNLMNNNPSDKPITKGYCPKCGAECRWPSLGAYCFVNKCQGTFIPPIGSSR
jgi:hypothetical protein